MINNTDRIENELEELYAEGGMATAKILAAILEAIRQAKLDKDLKTLEVTQENPESQKPLSLDDLTIESSTPGKTPKLELDDLTIEQDNRKSKTKESNTPEIPTEGRKILFGKSEEGFVNNMSPEQEKAVAQMLMNKPGIEIPGAENLVIRYKGEIIASTNERGVLEANELYGKISPEILQQLAEAVAKTPIATAPERAAPVATPPAPAAPAPAAPVATVPVPVPAAAVPAAPVLTASVPAPAPVTPEKRITSPIKRVQIPDGNPITQVQAALSAVAAPGNGVANLAAEIRSSTSSVVRAINPITVDPKSIVGVAAISTGKVAGIIDWIETNTENGGKAISPNGYVGEVSVDSNNEKIYTLKDPKGGLVVSGTQSTRDDQSTTIQIDKYNSKGIGKEWEAIKKSQPEINKETPVAATVIPNATRLITLEELSNIKNIADKYVVEEGVDKQVSRMDSDPNLFLGYEKLSNGKTKYSLYDKADPYAKVSFSYDEGTNKIEEVKQTTTPSMLSLVEKANAHMRQENIELKNAADRVNIAEDLEPGSQAAAPKVALGQEIPLSSVPAPTTQAPDATEKLSQQQIATISKSIAIIDATCTDQDSREAELEHTRVSIEDKDKNTKLYTIQDLDTKEESQFSYNKTTGEIVTHKSSDAVMKLVDKEEKIFEPVIPGYSEIVKATSKQIEKSGEISIVGKGKGEITRSSSNRKSKTMER